MGRPDLLADYSEVQGALRHRRNMVSASGMADRDSIGILAPERSGDRGPLTLTEDEARATLAVNDLYADPAEYLSETLIDTYGLPPDEHRLYPSDPYIEAFHRKGAPWPPATLADAWQVEAMHRSVLDMWWVAGQGSPKYRQFAEDLRGLRPTFWMGREWATLTRLPLPEHNVEFTPSNDGVHYLPSSLVIRLKPYPVEVIAVVFDVRGSALRVGSVEIHHIPGEVFEKFKAQGGHWWGALGASHYLHWYPKRGEPWLRLREPYKPREALPVRVGRVTKWTLADQIVAMLAFLQSKAIQPVTARAPRSLRRRAKRRGRRKGKRFRNSRVRVVQLREAVRVGMEAEKDEKARIEGTGGDRLPQVIHWRSGHWRQQPHGPGKSLRKLIFIEPYMAGSREPAPEVGMVNR